jgi:hypothetical protein
VGCRRSDLHDVKVLFFLHRDGHGVIRG